MAFISSFFLLRWQCVLVGAFSLLVLVSVWRQKPVSRDLETAWRAESTSAICFAEDASLLVAERWKEVQQNYQRGLKFAATRHILFAGIIRNGANGLTNTVNNLHALGAHFAQYRILIFENDSKDATVELLKKHANDDPRLSFRSEVLNLGDVQSGQGAERVQRMAHVRNNLHAWILDELHSEPWDYVAMVDMDLGTFGPHAIETDMVIAALGRRESRTNTWDVLCANSLRHFMEKKSNPIGHHDCFAFRIEGHDDWNEAWAWSEVAAKALHDYFPLKSVHSCFGGFAIYSPGPLARCRYDEASTDCEHVPLHACMRSSGSESRIFVDPLMTTYYEDLPRLCRPP